MEKTMWALVEISKEEDLILLGKFESKEEAEAEKEYQINTWKRQKELAVMKMSEKEMITQSDLCEELGKTIETRIDKFMIENEKKFDLLKQEYPNQNVQLQVISSALMGNLRRATDILIIEERADEVIKSILYQLIEQLQSKKNLTH